MIRFESGAASFLCVQRHELTAAQVLRLDEAARAGLEMNEVLALPLTPQFANLPMAVEEYRRSVGHLFPAAENTALGAAQ